MLFPDMITVQLIVDICQSSLPVLTSPAQAKSPQLPRRLCAVFSPGATPSRTERDQGTRALNFHPQRFWREILN